MKDFSYKKYKLLLLSLKNSFTFREYFNTQITNNIILRHDIDRSPKNALKMAELEHEMGIKATYFFRSRPYVFKEEIIKKIESLGHEIGYHYENLSDSKGYFEEAILTFSNTLENLREIVTVNTICMHGSPMSKWDNRKLWEKYDYHDFGIIAEPYFDINFDEVFYLTDAGRSWNNTNVSLRDKVKTKFNYKIKSTNDIINLLNSPYAPKSIMINIHPHNWSDNWFDWMKILIWQNVKNVVKRFLIVIRSK
ncbi:hypothetical protein KAU33_14475 [Candidatus Dependentiae bacterium]|nr:hypothetical protein [Candidatus Dependentiae bacterium]